MPYDRLWRALEAPAGDPCPHVQVDVLVEGEVALVVAAEVGEQLAPQQAGSTANAENLTRLQRAGTLQLPGPLLDRPSILGQSLPDAVQASRLDRARRGGIVVELEDARLDATKLRVSLQRIEQRPDASPLEHRVGVQHQDHRRRRLCHTKIDRRGESDVLRQRHAWHALALQEGERAVAGAVVDHHHLHRDALAGKRLKAGGKEADRVPARDHNGDGGGIVHGGKA